MTKHTDIHSFLGSPTPSTWVEVAAGDLETILIDHAHCEKKAASSALNLLFRYPDRDRLVHRMSRLAREELRHFEQVLKLMKPRGVTFRHLTPSRYAEGMRRELRSHEPQRLVDLLIVGAFIEARSCERFQALAPALEDREIADFYIGLCESESRHFRHYLELAEEAAGEDISARVEVFRDIESRLNLDPDSELRFHSGPPTKAA
ncbi:MAG: tRNA-(ms[2]io[6]A)-hydroxylase [Gammaproteobacteria bacterium]|nr:tRNA-(ms[2]io[6]A)-hydroxylase [Gammaproteobacteria bacterium]